jgi:hypothetical protein
MSFRAHGNWCGPGWSAGQWKDAKDLTEEDKQVEAIDALDQACKEHDIGIAEGDPLANQKFYTKAAQAGWYGLTMAQLVRIGGPSLQNYLRGSDMSDNKKKKNIRSSLHPQYVNPQTAQWERHSAIADKKRKHDGPQRNENPKRDIVENEDDDLEPGLIFNEAVEEAIEEYEEQQDQNVMNALVEMKPESMDIDDDEYYDGEFDDDSDDEDDPVPNLPR